MAAAAEGAARSGGLVIGILPTHGWGQAASGYPNEHTHIPIFTDMGDGRNYLNALTSDAIIALSGSMGTLSEVALALKNGKLVVSLGCANVEAAGISTGRWLRAQTAEEAVALVAEEIERLRQMDGGVRGWGG